MLHWILFRLAAMLVAANSQALRPLHFIENGKFRQITSLPLRSTLTIEGQGVENPWSPVLAESGAEGSVSIGARLNNDGGITLAPLSSDFKYVAQGTYHDDLGKVGWGSLVVHTNGTGDGLEAEDGVKMYAAGVVEGYLTAKRISEFHSITDILRSRNVGSAKKMPNVRMAFQRTVDALANQSEHADAYPASSLQGQARLTMLQTWGVRDGYTLSSGKPVTMPDLILLNSDGVIDELVDALGGDPSKKASLAQISTQRPSLRGRKQNATVNRHFAPKRDHGHVLGHCTSLVRLADDNKELYFGHTTVECYSEMTRIWKVYDFPLKGAAATKISFSSYPGCISSTDDYMLMDSGIAVMETTLDIPRPQTYPSSQSIPDFMRIMAASRLAHTSEEWIQSMLASATGTYSSQWMVMDYKKFQPGQELPAGSFFVFEQAPEAHHYEDMSAHLNQKRYWASYNRAWFDDIRKTTGDDIMVEDLGDEPDAEMFTKGNTPRAQVAAHTEGTVNSLADMRKAMSSNKGTAEPIDEPSLRTPLHAISPRNDVIDNAGHKNTRGDPFGGVDGKITSSCLFNRLTAQAISSPSHSTLPAFEWVKDDGTEVWPDYPREGLPTKANFDWVNVNPSVNPSDSILTALDNGKCH